MIKLVGKQIILSIPKGVLDVNDVDEIVKNVLYSMISLRSLN